MSASSYPRPARNLGRIVAALGFFAAISLLAVGPAAGWGGGGGGGGGGGKPPTAAPAPAQNDPGQMRKLRDLTKRLKAELRFDNQKSNATRAKEVGQVHDMHEIMGPAPNQNDPDVKAADDVIKQWEKTVSTTDIKHEN